MMWCMVCDDGEGVDDCIASSESVRVDCCTWWIIECAAVTVWLLCDVRGACDVRGVCDLRGVCDRWTSLRSPSITHWQNNRRSLHTALNSYRKWLRSRRRWNVFIRPLSRPCQWCSVSIVYCQTVNSWKHLASPMSRLRTDTHQNSAVEHVKSDGSHCVTSQQRNFTDGKCENVQVESVEFAHCMIHCCCC